LATGSPTGKLVFHVFAALAEFERALIRERTLAGLKAARARGRHSGRPSKLQPEELKTIRALLKTAEVSVQEIAARFGVSRSTLYRNKINLSLDDHGRNLNHFSNRSHFRRQYLSLSLNAKILALRNRHQSHMIVQSGNGLPALSPGSR
jgi:DNA invertase Pin-like site-specific DNA recombinase